METSKEEILKTVNLYTPDLGFVAKVKVFPYITFKDCLIHWGSRFFKYDGNLEKFIEVHYMIANPHELMKGKRDQ